MRDLAPDRIDEAVIERFQVLGPARGRTKRAPSRIRLRGEHLSAMGSDNAEEPLRAACHRQCVLSGN